MNLRTKLFLAGLGALTLATLDTALAFQIDPQCQALTDNSRANQVSCTCALQNGGTVQPWRGKTTWRLNSRVGARPPEFTKCIKANGGEE